MKERNMNAFVCLTRRQWFQRFKDPDIRLALLTADSRSLLRTPVYFNHPGDALASISWSCTQFPLNARHLVPSWRSLWMELNFIPERHLFFWEKRSVTLTLPLQRSMRQALLSSDGDAAPVYTILSGQ